MSRYTSYHLPNSSFLPSIGIEIDEDILPIVVIFVLLLSRFPLKACSSSLGFLTIILELFRIIYNFFIHRITIANLRIYSKFISFRRFLSFDLKERIINIS
ncbi:hypothetical protein ACHQM5_025619 [Ranunculus cassubicifolius]